MIPEILRTFILNIPYSSDDSILSALISVADGEIFDNPDSVRREVLNLLWTTQSSFENPVNEMVLSNISPEL
jgi:hypothetical protein